MVTDDGKGAVGDRDPTPGAIDAPGTADGGRAEEPSPGGAAVDAPLRVHRYSGCGYSSVLGLLLLGWALWESVRTAIAFSATTGDTTVSVFGYDVGMTHFQAVAFHWSEAGLFVFLCVFVVVWTVTQLVLQPRIQFWDDRMCAPEGFFRSRPTNVPYAKVTKVTFQSVWLLSGRQYFLKIEHPGGHADIFANDLPRKREDLDKLTDWLRQKCRPGVVDISLEPPDDLRPSV